MKFISTFVLLLVFTILSVKAQEINGNDNPCILDQITYNVTLPKAPKGCSYKGGTWTLTSGGQSVLTTNGRECTIQWDEVPRDAKLKFSIGYSDDNTSDGIKCDGSLQPTMDIQVGMGGGMVLNTPPSVVAGSFPYTFSATQKRNAYYSWDYNIFNNGWEYNNYGEPGGSEYNKYINNDANAYRSAVYPGFESQIIQVTVGSENCVQREILQKFVEVVPPSTLELESSTGSFAIPCVSSSSIRFNIKNLREGLPLTYRWRLPGGNWNSNK
jgi:hypothetical protein